MYKRTSNDDGQNLDVHPEILRFPVGSFAREFRVRGFSVHRWFFLEHREKWGAFVRVREEVLSFFL
jgi:hypothetical protein